MITVFEAPQDFGSLEGLSISRKALDQRTPLLAIIGLTRLSSTGVENSALLFLDAASSLSRSETTCLMMISFFLVKCYFGA